MADTSKQEGRENVAASEAKVPTAEVEHELRELVEFSFEHVLAVPRRVRSGLACS